ncbi:MAG: FtsX-like permease family protein [Motiliproteus sp.]
MRSPTLLTSWRHFQRHPGQLLLLLLGILIGVAAVTAVDLVNQSARESFRMANEQLLGRSRFQINGDAPLPEALYRRLRTELALSEATPVVSGLVNDGLDKGILLRVIGIDPLAGTPLDQGFDGVRLNPPLGLAQLITSQHGVILDSRTASQLEVAVGDSIPIITQKGRQTISVLSLLEGADDPRSNNLLIMDIGQAQQLLGLSGRLTQINLTDLDQQQQARIRAWLPSGYRLQTAQQRHQSTAGLTDSFHLNLTALSLLALMVGLLLVYNSTHFSLIQRQPMFGQLRALGVTAAEVRRAILWETLAVAILGSLLGVLVGIALAQLLFGLVVQTIDDLYLSNNINRLFISVPMLLKSLLIGTGGCLLASWPSIRQLSQIPPRQSQLRFQQEQSAARSNRLSLYLAGGLLASSALLAVWRGSGLIGGFIAIAALLLGLALMTPMLVAGISRLLSAPALQRYPNRLAIWRMALRDCYRSLSRTGVAVMALMIAVAATIGMAVMIDSFRSSLEGWLQQRLNADIYLRVQLDLPGKAEALTPELIAYVRNHQAVRAMATSRRIASNLNGRRVEVFSNNLPEPMRRGYQFTNGDPDTIWTRLQNPDQVLISEPLANRWQLAIDDCITLQTGSGRHAFTVAGIYLDYGSDNGRILLPESRFNDHWGDALPTALGVYLQPSADADHFISELQQQSGQLSNKQPNPLSNQLSNQLPRQLSGQRQPLEIRHTARLLQKSLQVFERTFRITDVLRLLAMGVAAIGILGALMALQLERQGELHILRSLGLTPLERAKLLLYQSGWLGLLAGLIAIPSGHLLAWLLIEVIHLRAFGWSMVYQPSLSASLLGLLLSVAAALLASLWPAWRFARYRPRLQTE